jgi:hypothetical protein
MFILAVFPTFLCTVLLLAYFNGNGSLCRAVVKAGAQLGTVNRDGLSIFNAPVATKQLLIKLLGKLWRLAYI